MKKIVIPAILAATVLVAGIFAFMPVDKASTVHDQIIAALQGANIVRIVTPIDHFEDDGSTTWSQIVTYDRTGGDGAWQIEKLFLCDLEDPAGETDGILVSFDVESELVGSNINTEVGGIGKLSGSGTTSSPRTTFIVDRGEPGICWSLNLGPNDVSDEFFQHTTGQIFLGGDENNSVNVRLFDTTCDSTADTNGAFLVAYIVGLVDKGEMNVIVDDDFDVCPFE